MQIKKAILAIAMSIMVACATSGSAAPASPPVRTNTPVHVLNRSWCDVTIRYHSDGISTRLGRVNALGTGTLKLPVAASSASFSIEPFACSERSVILDTQALTDGADIYIVINGYLPSSYWYQT